jgi:hypothetical protein
MDIIESEAVVVSDERHPGGRPLKMTVQRFLRICAWIEKGKSNLEACRIEQVRYTSFRGHAQKKPRWQKRYELADRTRDNFLRDFHLANIVKHSEKQWTASAWLLERKFPSAFAMRTVSRPDDAAHKTIEDEIPAEVLAKHRARMLELARQDEAETAAKALPNSDNTN